MMKLDLDLIRELLLTLEDNTDGWKNFTVEDVYLLGQEIFDLYGGLDVVEYHIKQLSMGDYILTTNGYNVRQGNGYVIDLTWEGHEFVRNITHPSIWKQFKSKLSPISYNVSLSVAGQIAAQLVKQQIGLA